jgi:3-isopropylmalate dehydrogenase
VSAPRRTQPGGDPAPRTDRWTACLPGAEAHPSERSSCVIGAVPGEGIGPEVVGAALAVLEAVATSDDLPIEVRSGGDTSGRKLSAEVAGLCESVFAAGGSVLCGPVGGRFVYELRGRFDLYCKIVPIRPTPVLADAAIVRPERLVGVDLLIVRENVGGVYFGEYGRRDEGRVAYQNFSYRAEQVSRIVAVAARLAEGRRGRLTVIVKNGGIPEVSALWREQGQAAAAETGVEVEALDVDNAGFQLIAQPQRFDVVVAPNLLGDVLADSTTALLGSRGLSYSANLGSEGRAVYQTGHGAAYDLAGSDQANPVAQILTLAAMLRESFGLVQAAAQVESAVERVLASGFRTPDIAGPHSRVVGTRELAERIAEEASKPRDARVDVS